MPDAAITVLPGVDDITVVNEGDGIFQYTSVSNGKVTKATISPTTVKVPPVANFILAVPPTFQKKSPADGVKSNLIPVVSQYD